MKIAILSVLALVTMVAGISVPQKAVIVSYPDNTPQSIISEAMDAIKKAGGTITHEYTIIKGFAANAPAKILETVQSLSSDYNAIIEEDQMVSTQGGSTRTENVAYRIEICIC